MNYSNPQQQGWVLIEYWKKPAEKNAHYNDSICLTPPRPIPQNRQNYSVLGMQTQVANKRRNSIKSGQVIMGGGGGTQATSWLFPCSISWRKWQLQGCSFYYNSLTLIFVSYYTSKIKKSLKSKDKVFSSMKYFIGTWPFKISCRIFNVDDTASEIKQINSYSMFPSFFFLNDICMNVLV